MRDIRLAMTGFGNVGQGIAQLILEHSLDYQRRYGVRLVLTGVADRGGGVVQKDGLEPAALLAAKREHGTVCRAGGDPTLQGQQFLEAAAADVLLEAASTNFDDAEPGWSYTRNALVQGMDVVLASKGALVLYFDELFALAKAKDRQVLYAGTTGAPLPVREVAEYVLPGAMIDAFEGIVNVTANVILEEMGRGASYEDGVAAAQRAGVAETDPTLDVDGWDAAAKAMIVARTVFAARISLQDVRREGIRGVSPDDLRQAQVAGETVKLIAHVQRDGSSVRAWVGPEARPLTDPLGRLRGIEVGMIYRTDPLGAVTTTVQDTGPIPTALAVLRDVFNLARSRGWTQQ